MPTWGEMFSKNGSPFRAVEIRGSVRVIVATKRQDRWFFLYGFEKNERANINAKELKSLQKIAAEFLNMDEQGVAKAIIANELVEVFDDIGQK